MDSTSYQIPRKLKTYFEMEELYEKQLAKDYRAFSNYSKVYLMSNDTILRRKWEGQNIAQGFYEKRLLVDELFLNDHVCS